MTEKKTRALHREGPVIMTTYAGSIDLKCKRGGSVASMCDSRGRWNCCIWLFTPHWLQTHDIPTPHSVFPCPPRGRRLTYLVPLRFMRTGDDGRDHLPIYYEPGLIWVMIHMGREVTGPETLLMGETRKIVQECRAACVDVCECLRRGGLAFTWGCFVEHIICNLSFKSSGGGELSVLGVSNNR